MNFRSVLLLPLALAACSGLSTLTGPMLELAETRWREARPQWYRLEIEMTGDRVENGTFEVHVDHGAVVSLKRNGKPVATAGNQDYSMDGLFKMLKQERELAEKPGLLGAPAGYSAYLMARFDDTTGRLIQYRRTVGGTRNTIDIAVVHFEPIKGSD